MDHCDWYDELQSKPEQFDRDYMRRTLQALYLTLKPGGRVFWRSAAMDPWYALVYKELGFKVERISVRNFPQTKLESRMKSHSSHSQVRKINAKVPIDNVNMYASFWKATKPV